MEGQEACGEVDRNLGCHDILSSAFLLDHVRESLKRKGLLLGDAATASASAAADIAVAAPVDIAQEKNNVQPVWEDDARPFKDRDVAWILARKNSRKRNMQLRSLDFSAFGQVELLSSEGIQSLLVEGARTGAIFGPAEKSCTAEKRSFDKTGCSTEITTTTPGCDPSIPEAAAHGKMDPLTPEIVQQTCRGTSPGSSADYTSPPETTDAGNLLSSDREAPFRAPAMANGASAMLAKGTSSLNVPPSRGAQPRPQEQVTKQEVPANLSVANKSTRKRKYQPKIRAENPRPRSRAKRESVDAVKASLPAEIPETTSSPSLVQMQSSARINQRGPRLKRPRRGKVAAAAISEESPANSAPGCSAPPRPTADPAYQDYDAIFQNADFLRCLYESLFSVQATKFCPADRANSSCTGSLCTSSSHLAEVEVDVDCSPAEENPPSTPRGAPVPLESTCRDFTLLRSPWSPPSPHGAYDVSDPWNNFDDITNSQDHFSAKSVRRALQFDAAQLQQDHAHLCQVPSQGLAAAPDIDLLQVPAEELSVPQVVNLDPGGPGRENELQVVAYDEGSKRMVVYQPRVPRVRRVRYKPKVNLDARTVRMFKILTIKAAGVGEEAAEDEKTSWERSRQVWQHRAHHFISIMRQVQGNRSFSRWKGSVVDSVGGAFLTQNVSDFLSSNAFISLRARFPARSRETNTAETTPKAESPVEKIEKQRSIKTDPSLPRPAESPTSRKEDHQRREEGWNEPCRSGENFPGEGSPPRHEAAAQGPVISTATQSITERTPHHMTSEEMAVQKNSNPQTALLTAAPEFEALHHLNQQNISSSDAPFFGLTSDFINSSPQQDVVVVVQPKCLHTLSTVVADGELDHGETKSHQQSSNSSWKGKRAAPGVLQKKFASVVAAERSKVSSLTPVGQEENSNLVLAATLTLQLVLGMKPATQEQLLLRLRDRLHTHEKNKALRSPKQQLLLQLRPGRALLRSSTNNYRYRRSVSFKLLAGEARASWEAGFVMKSQKAKWEPRRAAIVGDAHYRRDPWTADCVDWNAVHKASVHEVAQVIKNRGMNNALAGRMKAFLDRVHRDQNDGSIDLEWIRWLPPEEAKAFLLSFRGVGIKSVECIRLLTLHHPSFPVDTNVGRILVRLGWVPLEPLPEETQLHLLELYPIQSQIQQYAWPRLCTLDQKTLYELHYQMITFGKVFCTKSKPNCNACPMRTECKHYASSYASAKLLLKGREEQEKQATAILAVRGTEPATESIQYGTTLSGTPVPCIPIIEEPYSPEPNIGDRSIPDIEELPVDFDTGAGVSVEIVSMELSSSEPGSLVTEELCVTPDVKKTLGSLDLNREPEEETNVLLPTAVMNLEKNGVDMTTIATMPNNETRVAVEDDEEVLQGGVPDDFKHLPSQELILLPPQPNMAPAPKLKNIQRLRTVHFVYELPDNHPLLFEMDKREDDDPCFYLLAIWSPDEVPATMPKINDDESTNPFASCEEGCNEDPEQTTVRGTLLIPCKTAMRGWFPLNGTYFQVNEVFADHASSVQPIAVPRTLLWSLRRRFVYFSTAVSNLFKDMSQDEIQCCFQKGYVCLRAFDVATREPRILAPRLHQSGAKIVKAPTPRKGRPRKTPSKSPPQTKINTGREETTSQVNPQL